VEEDNGNSNARDQSFSVTTHVYSAAQPHSTPQRIRQSESQPAVQPTREEEEEYCDIVVAVAGENPYDDFFQSSQPSPPSEPCDPFPRSRLWDIIRMKRYFFVQRALSANSPLQVPTNSEPTKPTDEQKIRVGDKDTEHENDIDLPDCSANTTPRAAGWNNDKGKQEEEYIADTQTHPRNDPTRPAEFDNNGNRALRKLLMHTRRKDAKKTSAKIPCDLSPEVVEVCAARGFKRLVIVSKRKHKTKSRASQAAGSPSSHTFQNVTTSDSDSDSIIESSWNKFLDNICFPCGHYHEDTTT